MGVKENIVIFCKAKRLPISTFEAKCGFSNGYVRSIRKGVSQKKLERILEEYPELNEAWLLTGNGEMLKTTTINNESGVVLNGQNHHNTIDNRQYYSDSPDVLRAQIEVLDERIKEKDAQIKEKDAQIKEKDAQIRSLLTVISNLTGNTAPHDTHKD